MDLPVNTGSFKKYFMHENNTNNTRLSNSLHIISCDFKLKFDSLYVKKDFFASIMYHVFWYSF